MMRFSEDEVLPFDGIPDQSSNVCGLVGILKIFVYFFFLPLQRLESTMLVTFLLEFSS